jgi:hypothetical protein
MKYAGIVRIENIRKNGDKVGINFLYERKRVSHRAR